MKDAYWHNGTRIRDWEAKQIAETCRNIDWEYVKEQGRRRENEHCEIERLEYLKRREQEKKYHPLVVVFFMLAGGSVLTYVYAPNVYSPYSELNFLRMIALYFFVHLNACALFRPCSTTFKDIIGFVILACILDWACKQFMFYGFDPSSNHLIFDSHLKYLLAFGAIIGALAGNGFDEENKGRFSSFAIILVLTLLFAAVFILYNLLGTAVTQDQVSTPSQVMIIDKEPAPPPVVETIPSKTPPKSKGAPKPKAETKPKTEAKPKTEPKSQIQLDNKEMRVPVNAWKDKDFSFLEGCWNYTASTSKESEYQYCFDASGKGTRTYTKQSSNSSCSSGSVQARFDSQTTLFIGSEGFACGDGNHRTLFSSLKMWCTLKGGRVICHSGRFSRI
jgi:hypothetical protein